MINLSTSSKKLGNEFDTAGKFERAEGKSKESFSEADKIWEKFLVLLSDTIKQVEINTWFSVISPKSFENNVLTLVVPSEDYYAMVERRYNKQLSAIIESGLLGANGKIRYEVRQLGLFSSHDAAQESADKISNPSILTLKPGTQDYSAEQVKVTDTYEEKEDFQSNLYPKHTFASFVKGESNELAVAAAFAITNNPGKTYNPFFVYGGVGLGKTHLVQAIGNEIIKKFPEKKIYYTTAPDFTTQFTTNIAKDRIDFSNAAGTKKLDSFYKSLDVLIIDDIQNLSGKEKTQDFMYQIFNTLFNEKKHIIFSSDKPINQIKGIEERLISRFQWGITVDIQPPNWEMRVAIIQRKLEESNISAPEEVIHYIATNVKDSIRTVEGCIVGMIAESALIYKGEINMNVAEKVIKRVIGHVTRAKNISIENILYTVANYYKISENQILSRKRTKEIAFARQVAMYLAKELTNLTLESIGLNFGGKDHATVLYAYNSISELMKRDESVKSQIQSIREQISNL